MDCSDAKHLIHLDVGDDLRVDEKTQLAEHMGQCSECRFYHTGMTHAMNALVMLREAPATSSERIPEAQSVWPSVSREIQRRRTGPSKVMKFNLQVVALSVCSLSLAVVTIVQSLSSMRGSADAGGFIPAQPVSIPVHMPRLQHDNQPAPNRALDHLFPADVSRPQSF